MEDNSNNSDNSENFGVNSYGMQSDEELNNYENDEHELLNATRQRPEIINQQWWFVDLYFTNQLLLDKPN